MKKIKNILIAFAFAIVLSVSLILSTNYSHAQDILPLTVGPARQQITVNPGEQAAFSIKFYNESDSPLTGIVRVADFVVQDKDGSPRIVDDVSQGSPKFSASAWVTLPYDRMSIPSNDKVTVQASLAVPQDARPGGRYIAVYFEPSIPVPQAVGSETVGQGISPRIASLLYVRVSGPITESAIISNLFAKSFYEYGPIQINAEILNRGDYHIRPRGVLTLVDPIGSTTEQTSLKEENIFPDAARAYENKLGTKWMMGRYKITLAASYGEKGQAIERSVFVWVFPWRVATVILLSIIIVILLITGMYKRLVTKESSLEEEISKEREEIEKLKEELKKRKE
ncbi:hypothetical protein A2334_03095 [Candidatus Roizmanbacteria bacterium RIFOXYB2_FULL_38_10]|uniref:DUF916 domain-containing protein n=1 Tax=Candidatus Roizmanbacteria bacterium RIFOXYD1_FULL_38_12 TaxID=1802093 RepID=A0A1F7L1P3_9BACT|nr:MAG: hypothetical protein A3K47_04670 [Candidatus Roizmanbacteria bacterium RIFOXYA2_FULL_38_14]OGK64044.1 MAG: hypothetical protein A3K27_04670 [Candidatus Roizmanbacteria bacterium RIFOXYA1_FULL_37_12]OGK65890.1 MAG: hypothetical protein A3K38_04670 [Candidatus Roizmanbacteria bacterium RIFOXYB1_FULL_40_23]OGK68108.1 MAG: hypothetical protein A2334_03095 [Candidatus Roizmanbacteria bacterium RIFOXYB2_FULL_38_10]OGK70295.1 MAG: hypothetical protein A3K21_04675 [Candidatus Roizmanbacteria ba